METIKTNVHMKTMYRKLGKRFFYESLEDFTDHVLRIGLAEIEGAAIRIRVPT